MAIANCSCNGTHEEESIIEGPVVNVAIVTEFLICSNTKIYCLQEHIIDHFSAYLVTIILKPIQFYFLV